MSQPKSAAETVAGGALAAGATLILAYLLVIRPWHLRWGATDEEVSQPMPGDGIVEHPHLNATRAITIEAPPEAVWQWLVQMGQGRAGFYTYDRIENLASMNIHSADRILPEFQHLEVGDIIPTDPNGEGFTITALEPNRSLVMVAGTPRMGHVSVATVLEPVDERSTRLATRLRARFSLASAGLPFFLIFDPGDFVMMRKMLLGIKERAERGGASQGHHLMGTTQPASSRKRPGRLLGLFFKVPAHLYRGRMANVLAARGELLLITTGRKTGLPRTTPLNFITVDGAYVVTAGWGSRSDWYRNLLANPQVVVQVGRHRFAATAEPVEEPETRRELMRQVVVRGWQRDQPPRLVRWIMRTFFGFDYDAVQARALTYRESVPVVRLLPRGGLELGRKTA